jgi:UDP-N-acetylmuramyl pentapeptide phosphotransferase/UDP-N-acetylglucosamine-1-phosphate transferase
MQELLNLLKETTPLWGKVLAGFGLAFVIAFSAIPTIVRVAHMKDLCAKPNQRTSHMNATPNLGGIALFIGFLIATILVTGDKLTSDVFYFISGLIILFFIGIKDDVLIIDPKKKLAAQIIVALIIALFADIKLVSLFGIFGISGLSYFTSILLTVLLILVITNGFNLIDGIDGLASGAGIITTLFFGTWFWNIHDIAYTVICFALAGSLSGFFLFNVFGKKNKIFLGDTGSLILGLTISVVVIKFLGHETAAVTNRFSHCSPEVVIGVLILPLFDLLRVFTIRILQGKSPFIADHQHIHHLLLGLGYSHLKSSLVLFSVNIFFILFCYFLQDMDNLILILLTFALATAMSYFLKILFDHHRLKIALARMKASEKGELKVKVHEPALMEA